MGCGCGKKSKYKPRLVTKPKTTVTTKSTVSVIKR